MERLQSQLWRLDRVLVLCRVLGLGDPDAFIVVVSYPYCFSAMFTNSRFRKCDVDIHDKGLLSVKLCVES